MGPAGLVPVDEQALRLPSSNGGQEDVGMEGREAFLQIVKFKFLPESKGRGPRCDAAHLRVPKLLRQVIANIPATLECNVSLTAANSTAVLSAGINTILPAAIQRSLY